jgi:hypothetical protein
MYGLRQGLGAEAMGPPVPPDTVPSPPDVQQQIADVWSYLWSQPGAVPPVASVPPPAPAQTFSQWLNANTTTVFIGAAAFVALFAFAKAGR